MRPSFRAILRTLSVLASIPLLTAQACTFDTYHGTHACNVTNNYPSHGLTMIHQLPANCPFDLDRHGQYQTAGGLITFNSTTHSYTHGILTIYLGIGSQVLSESIDYFDPRDFPQQEWYDAQLLTTYCAGLATIDSPNSVDSFKYSAINRGLVKKCVI